ncbi:hypothetical protein FACS189413_11000 [Bacteroidia bacterium]|nr:hypothetical protein FACS189413_11000 [Bacteroidia bacterium]
MAQQPPQLGKASVDEVIEAMTLEEKASLVIGSVMPEFGSDSGVVGFTDKLVPGAAGTTFPIERLGIPPIVLADGPAGLRISPTRKDDKNTYYCTAFPVATLLASTWNTELVENVGKAIGNEVLEYGADVLLAPALNIHRNPLCGRNFEYYSEDPLISGKTTAAIVRGVQSNGVGTSIKHFFANSQEINRFGNDALISQRALREIYLKGFEIAVKESNPWTLMTSYNLVNGVYTSEDREILTNVLRNEWGFKGVVMSDWFGGKTAPLQIYAGNDLLMPGRLDQKEAIIQAVRDGSLHESYLDTDVRRILNLILASPRFKGYRFSNKPDLKAHATVARQSAAEGMVLLKNEGKALPLNKSVKKVAAFGVTSYNFISGGKGSGDVNKAYNVSLTDGLKNNKYMLNDDLKQKYETYIAEEKAKFKSDPDNPFTVFLSQRIKEWIPGEAELSSLAQKSDVAFITIGRSSGEFYDRKVDNDFNLTAEEQSLIHQTCKAFHEKGKKVIVILNICGVIETASWKSQPDAILLAWQAGQEGGNAVADILTGKVNPSGKLATTFPLNYQDVPSVNFPSNYTPEKSSMIGGRTKPVNPAEWIPNVDYTVYGEDIFVGYRYYDTYNKTVSFPFGYGLSYTTFQYTNAQISNANGTITISVTVKNTGNIAGKEVVELYVAAPKNQFLSKPAKELKAFSKTKELAPGETQTIKLSVKTNDLASYDETAKSWITDAGNYRFLLGTSSADIREALEIDINTASGKNTGRESLYNDYIKVYVSVSGNDNAVGNQSKPFKTIGKAIERIEQITANPSNYNGKKGIAILLKAGTYKIEETIHLNPALTRYGELCFDGIEDGVVLSGKEVVAGEWEIYRDGIYRTNIGAGKLFRELYVNNQSAIRARYPNISGKGADKDIIELDKYTKDKGQAHFYFELHSNTAAKNYMNRSITDPLKADLGSVEMFMIQEWALSIGQITDIGYETSEIKGNQVNTVYFRLNADAETNFLNRGWPRVFTEQPHWLENSLALLDAPNEWYYNQKDGYLYYKPTNGTNINTLTIEYPGKAKCLFEIKGAESTVSKNKRVKNIAFRNLTIEGSNWTIPSKNGYVDQQNGQYNIGKEDWMERPQSAILLEWAENITFEGNTIRNMASTALDCYQGTKNIQIIGNAFADIGGSAVSFGQRSEKAKNIGKMQSYEPVNREEITQQIYIENNYFEACGKTYLGTTAIAGGYCMEIYIRHNEVNGSEHDAINVGWGWQTEKSVMREIHIDNNRLLNVKANTLLYDGSGLYVLGVHDVTDVDETGYPLSTMNGNYMVYLGGACGLYFDNGITHFSAKNNVVDGRKKKGHYNLGHVYINDSPLREWTILNIHVENTYATDLLYTGPMDGGTKEYHNNVIFDNKPDNGVQRTDRNITVKNSILIPDADWSKISAAQAIVNASGLEDNYKHIKLMK